ncbi:MAG: YicC/YloC family endoribonuclease [Pseudomonadota bacterium]
MAAKPQSMTGFGSAQLANDQLVCRCDIRSVNGKGLDIKLRLPSGFEALEVAIKKRVSNGVGRGNVQLFLAVEHVGAKDGLAIDMPVLRSLHAQALAAAEELGMAPPTTDGLLALRGVINSEDVNSVIDLEDEAFVRTIHQLIDDALAQLVEGRKEEGAALVAILMQHLVRIGELIDAAETDGDSQPEAISMRFHQQLGSLLGSDLSVDPQRLASEVALLVTKADVREEIDRLKTHVEAAKALLGDGDVIGRRFDFLTQEFNREANTLCSKSVSKGLTAIGLELKAVIDQMREQVQNLQ